MTAPLRFGLIGYGAWGSHHARAISSLPGVILAAVCARSGQGRQQAQTDHPRARVYTDYRQMLDGWEHHQTAKITGTEGALWARWSGAMDRTFEPTFSLQSLQGDRLVEVPIEKKSGEVYELVDEIDAFARAIRDGTPPACSGEDGRWSVAICLRAEQSLVAGRPVLLP